jgi:hypothetical protein
MKRVATHVAFLDILGFKDRVRRDGIDKVYGLVSELLQNMESTFSPTMTRGWLENDESHYFHNYAKVFNFSDTLILMPNMEGYREKQINLLNEMRQACPELQAGLSTEQLVDMNKENEVVHIFYTSLRCLMISSANKGIPLCGATAFGEVILDEAKGILIGQPIIDAYELENRQNWIGIAFHPNTARYKIGESEPSPTMWSRRNNVPMDGGKTESHLVLEWFRDNNTSLVNERTIANLEEMRKHAPESAREKYDNTLAFAQALSERWKAASESRLESSKSKED